MQSDVANRAKAIYEERIRPLVEKEHSGKVVSIEVDSGDYQIAEDRQDRWSALDRLRSRHEKAHVFSLRVGGGPVAKISGCRTVKRTVA